MMFKVWTACKTDSHCENYEAARVVYDKTDALEAINAANMLRDNDHESWIEVV